MDQRLDPSMCSLWRIIVEQRPKCKGLTVEYLIDSTEKQMLGNYTFQTSNGYNVEIKQRPHRIIDV